MLPDRSVFIRTKIGGKCQNSKVQMRHIEQFSNNVNRRNLCFPSTFGNCGQIKVGKGSSEKMGRRRRRGLILDMWYAQSVGRFSVNFME